LSLLVASALAAPSAAFAAGDVQDQFYRHVEIKNKVFEAHLPGEVVDHFTGTLRILQEDLRLPGKAGLDLKIVRSYSSRIWGRTDAGSLDHLLAEKDASPLGFGWSIHMGRLQRPTATGQPLACGGGDYPLYEAPDGTARTFYPLPGGFTHFISRDSWKLDTQCTTRRGAGACITTTTGDRLEFASVDRFSFTNGAEVWPMTAHEDVSANVIQVAYLSGGLVDEVTDTWNRTVTFTYNSCPARQCLESITAAGPGGSRQVRYSYTTFAANPVAGSRAFLTGVTPAVGRGYTYTYGTTLLVPQNRYALTSITYPFGGTTTYTYGERRFFSGRESTPMAVVLRRTTSGRGLPTASWDYEYDAPQAADFQTTTVTRPDMKKDSYQFYGFGLPARMNATGHVWKVGLQTRVSRADGAETEDLTWDRGAALTTANFAAPSYGSACTAWLWDTVVQAPVLTRRVITRGGSRYEMEASGHDAFGQPGTVEETGEAQRSSPPSRTTTYTYNYDMASYQVVGRVSREETCQGSGTSDCMVAERTFTSPHRRMDSETLKGVTTGFRYGPNGDLEEVRNALNQDLDLTAYQNGVPTQLDFNGAFGIHRSVYWDGALQTESNGRGFDTEYTYDLAGRLETVTPPGTDASTYTYDPTGAGYSVTRGTGSSAFTETTTLDGLGRVIETRTSLGVRRTWEYDGMGRLVFTSYPFATGAPEVGDRFEYDGLGRPTTTSRRFMATGHRPLAGACVDVNACKVTVVYQADHCRSTTVDRALGDRATTRACFNSFADPAEERLRLLTDAAAKSWTYTYDVAGNLEAFRAPQSAGDRTFTYKANTFFKATEESGPRGEIRVTQHDDLGQPLTQRDAAGAVTTFEYHDPLARPTHVVYGQGGVHDVTRTYDRDVLKTVSSTAGGTYTYGYDEPGRTTSQDWVFQGRTYHTGYEYDGAGCLKNLTYPTGTVAAMTCDPLGRPLSVTRKVGTFTETIAQGVTYHPMGRVASMTFGNNHVVTTGVEHGRLESIVTPGVLDLSFTYDGSDNVKSLTDQVVPANTLSAITYDKLDRVLDVTMAAGLAKYRYDELGNRTERTVPGEGTTTYHYDTVTNRLSWSTGAAALPAGTLQWTPAERIAATSDGAVYQYDGMGRRVAKQWAAATVDVVYHYDTGGRLLAETTPSGTPVREYFYVADQLVAVHGCPAVNSSGCNVTQWYHTDHLGSVQARTDGAGTVVARAAYEPWGESLPTATGPALYSGRPLDTGLGLYDFGARAYAPQLGRFVSADTVWSPANPQGANSYAYVLDNPLKHTDPDGHWAYGAVVAAGAVIGAGYNAWKFRGLSGSEFAAKVVEGGFGGALMTLGYGAAGVVAYPALKAVGHVLGLSYGPRVFKTQAESGRGGAPAGGPTHQASHVETTGPTHGQAGDEGQSRSHASGDAAVRGTHGGDAVTASHLPGTSDHGEPPGVGGAPQHSTPSHPAGTTAPGGAHTMDSGIVTAPIRYPGPTPELIP
jgi:RHS repeat-associated protein